jgi:hypothetical protein
MEFYGIAKRVRTPTSAANRAIRRQLFRVAILATFTTTSCCYVRFK